MLRFTIGAALLPYIIIVAIIDAPILLLLLGGGETTWTLLPQELRWFFGLTMALPVTLAVFLLAWRADDAWRS